MPTAAPPSACTTTASPGRGAWSAGRFDDTYVCGRPTGDSLTDTRRTVGARLTWTLYTVSSQQSAVSSRQLQLQDEPVGHDLDAGVAVEGHQRLIDGSVGRYGPLAAICLRETVELGLQIPVGQRD